MEMENRLVLFYSKVFVMDVTQQMRDLCPGPILRRLKFKSLRPLIGPLDLLYPFFRDTRYIFFVTQAIIVTGGVTDNVAQSSASTDKTEMMTLSGNNWRLVTSANLPIGIFNTDALTLNNQVYVFGNYSITYI